MKPRCQVELHGRGRPRVATHEVKLPDVGWRSSCWQCVQTLLDDVRKDASMHARRDDLGGFLGPVEWRQLKPRSIIIEATISDSMEDRFRISY